MLEIRPNFEHCNKDLPSNATEAMICTFECTYCKTCAIEIFSKMYVRVVLETLLNVQLELQKW